MIHNIVCPSCGAVVYVTQSIKFAEHFRDGSARMCETGGKSARRAVRAAIMANIRQFRSEIAETQRLLAGAEKKLAALDKIGGAR